MSDSTVITGLGHMHPEHRITNSFFDELGIGSAAAWVEDRTGIESRNSVLRHDELAALQKNETNYLALRSQGRVQSIAAMSRGPWDMALQRRSAGLELGAFKPECMVCGTSVPDADIPANASLIAKELGLVGASFDVNSACSSFVTGLTVASSLMQTSSFASVALFNPERYSTRLNYNDRTSCILFGDGASCTLMEKGEHLKGLKLLGSYVESDSSGSDLVRIPIDGYFEQNGARVQRFAITKTCEASLEILRRCKRKISEVTYFVGHQANLRMLQSAAQKLGFSETQHLYNVHRFGNQGAAGAPIVLSENWDRFQRGDLILVAVVGAGLTWGAALFERV